MAQYSAGTYNYTSCDACSGGTATPVVKTVPHPVYGSNNLNDTVVQLTAVAIGGFNGLNN